MPNQEMKSPIYDSLIFSDYDNTENDIIEEDLIYYNDVCNIFIYVVALILLLLVITMLVLLFIKDG